MIITSSDSKKGFSHVCLCVCVRLCAHEIKSWQQRWLSRHFVPVNIRISEKWSIVCMRTNTTTHARDAILCIDNHLWLKLNHTSVSSFQRPLVTSIGSVNQSAPGSYSHSSICQCNELMTSQLTPLSFRKHPAKYSSAVNWHFPTQILDSAATEQSHLCFSEAACDWSCSVNPHHHTV